jgi:hypothetical protein
MMETTYTLNLTIDGRVKCLSWRGDPVDNGTLQPFRIVSASSIYTLLYL